LLYAVEIVGNDEADELTIIAKNAWLTAKKKYENAISEGELEPDEIAKLK
jgi:hypothetical protein